MVFIEQKLFKSWHKFKNQQSNEISDLAAKKKLFKLKQNQIEFIHANIDQLSPHDVKIWNSFIYTKNFLMIHDLVYLGFKNYDPKTHTQVTKEVDQIMKDLGYFNPISSKQLFHYLQTKNGSTKLSSNRKKLKQNLQPCHKDLNLATKIATQTSFTGDELLQKLNFLSFDCNYDYKFDIITNNKTLHHNSDVVYSRKASHFYDSDLNSENSNKYRLDNQISSLSKPKVVDADINARVVELKKKYVPVKFKTASNLEKLAYGLTDDTKVSNIRFGSTTARNDLINLESFDFYDDTTSYLPIVEVSNGKYPNSLDIFDEELDCTKSYSNSSVFEDIPLEKSFAPVLNPKSIGSTTKSLDKVVLNKILEFDEIKKIAEGINCNKPNSTNDLTFEKEICKLNVGSISQRISRYQEEVAKLVKPKCNIDYVKSRKHVETSVSVIDKNTSNENDVEANSSVLKSSSYENVTQPSTKVQKSIDMNKVPSTVNNKKTESLGNTPNLRYLPSRIAAIALEEPPKTIDKSDSLVTTVPMMNISNNPATTANVTDIMINNVNNLKLDTIGPVSKDNSNNLNEKMTIEVPYKCIIDLPAFIEEDDNIAQLMVIHFPYIQIVSSCQNNMITIQFSGNSLTNQQLIGNEISQILDQYELSTIDTIENVCQTSQADKQIGMLEREFPFRVWFVPSSSNGYIDWKYKGHNSMEKCLIGRKLKKLTAKYNIL